MLETIELHKPLFDDAINAVGELMLKYHLSSVNTKILVDASAPSVVSALKSQMGEAVDYLTLLNNRKKYKLTDVYFDMMVLPIVFTTAAKKEMLINLKELLDSEMVVMNPERHANLVLALRTATATDMILDKDKMSNSDILDAMTLAVRRISINRQEIQGFDFKPN